MARKKRRVMEKARVTEKYNATFKSTAKNSTKGSEYDTLNRQVAVRKELTDGYIDDLLSSNELSKILLTAPVEDSLKNGFEMIFTTAGEENLEIKQKIEEKMDELNFIEKLKELLVESRKRGYSMLYYIFNDHNNMTDKPVNVNSEMIGINVFTKKDIDTVKFEESKLSPDYGQMVEVKIKDKENNITQTVKIDPSRVELSYQNRTAKEIGTTIFNQLIDRVIIQDTTEWSIGQLIYRATFLKFKTDEATLSEIKRTGIDKKENEINASTFAAIGTSDDIDTVNATGGLDPEKYLNSAATILSIHSSIPKQRLMGNALGSIAGAEEDAKKYAEYLQRFFNTFAVPVIQGFIDKIIVELGYKNVSYEVYLDSLLEKDDLKEAATEEAEAKATNEKLKVIDTTISLMNRVGLNPENNKLKALIQQIKTGEKLTGQHLSELWNSAVVISETSLDIEKEKVGIMTAKSNMIMSISNMAEMSGFSGEKNKIAQLAKIAESENPYEDLIKLLGEKDVVEPESGAGEKT